MTSAIRLHNLLWPGVTTVQLLVPWETRVKKRPRVTASGYTYKEDAADEEATATLLKSLWHHPPMEGPVALTIVAYRRTKRRADIDNVAKHCLDSANGILYRDDSQVKGLHAEMVLDREHPRTELAISSYPEEG